MRFVRLLTIFVLSFLLASPAFAWTKSGHMVTGAIAYDVMQRDNPEALKEIIRILKKHPSYDKFLKKRVESVRREDRDRYLMMIAARWPDDVRGIEQYHCGPWHFINYPIVAKQDEGKLEPPQPEGETVITSIEQNLKTLTEGKKDADKAVAICWLLHCIGDAHQPLHTVSFFKSDYWPEGDWGGNIFYVKVTDDGETISLHSLWDGILGGSADYQDASKQAIELRLRPEFTRDMLSELSKPNVQDWVNESRELALHVAYRDTTLLGSTDEMNGPTLPEGYVDEAKAAAERRVLLSGYRMAQMLEDAVKVEEATKVEELAK